MNKLRKILLLLGVPVLALAQTSATNTTLSTALAAPGGGVATSQIVVASATGISAPSATAGATMLYVDREAMLTIAVSGTNITVARGVSGTPATGHKSGAIVWVGNPAGNQGPFHSFDPSGVCTRSSLPYVPSINILSGNKSDCIGGLWGQFQDFADRVTVGAAIASAATVAPIGPVTHITGTAAIVNITLPLGCPDTGCTITFIADGVFTFTAAGNIAVAGTTTTALSSITFTYDPATAKWYPSRIA